MDYLTEQRKYQRCSSTICKTSLSFDKKIWEEIELCDISAGGLKFFSSRDIDIDALVNFDISLYNVLSEFNMKFEGKIVRKENAEFRKVYAVKFQNTNKYYQIQLDEVIKSKIVVAKFNQPQPDYEGGVYTFFLIPRYRRGRIGFKI